MNTVPIPVVTVVAGPWARRTRTILHAGYFFLPPEAPPTQAILLLQVGCALPASQRRKVITLPFEVALPHPGENRYQLEYHLELPRSSYHLGRYRLIGEELPPSTLDILEDPRDRAYRLGLEAPRGIYGLLGCRPNGEVAVMFTRNVANWNYPILEWASESGQTQVVWPLTAGSSQRALGEDDVPLLNAVLRIIPSLQVQWDTAMGARSDVAARRDRFLAGATRGDSPPRSAPYQRSFLRV